MKKVILVAVTCIAVLVIAGAIIAPRALKRIRDAARMAAEERKYGEIRLPEVIAVEKGLDGAPATTVITIYHEPSVKCRTHEEDGNCLEPSHWKAASGLKDFDGKTIADFIRDEADLERDMENPKLSSRELLIRADRGAPYEYVQKVILSCALAGIYKIVTSVRDQGSSKAEGRMGIWLPTDRDVKAPKLVLPTKRSTVRRENVGPSLETGIDQIRIVLGFDRNVGDASKAVLRKVVGQTIAADDDFREVLRGIMAKHPEAGTANLPVIIDADPKVPWKEVVKAIELCRAEKLEKLQFAGPH